MSIETFLQNITPSQTQEDIQQPWGKLIPCLSTVDSIVLTKQSVKIGRAVTCDVVIDNKILSNDTSISKEHCLLTNESGSIYVTDLSKNGTFLNGDKIGKRNKRALKDNDKIAFVKDANNIYIFQLISMEELPDTLTSGSSMESPILMTNIVIPIWGRLLSCLLHLNSFDLSNPVFKVGRSALCDADIERMKIDSTTKRKFSKEHFVIFKSLENSITFITDLSKGGTYLNGRLIGKDKINVLQHDDTIQIGPKRTRVFVFKSMSPSDINYLPLQLRTKYEIANILGRGACGEVRLAYEKSTCKLFAIKKILKGRSTASQMCKLNHPSKIETEVKILESLSNPYVINMKEIVNTQDEVFIVLEYMRGGTLKDRIMSRVPLSETNVKFLFYQMVLAVQFLHLKGIAHRDLKPENVLLSSEATETIVKVSDFGLSKIIEDDDMMKTICGTVCYMAPEVLNPTSQYDKQADIWSLGVILFYMLSKKLPFESTDKKTLQVLIITGTYSMDNFSWNGISYLAKDLVRRMLTVNPQERITISEILAHPWLSKDVAIAYRIQSLHERQENSSTTDETDNSSSDIAPPSKRVRLSSSDESS